MYFFQIANVLSNKLSNVSFSAFWIYESNSSLFLNEYDLLLSSSGLTRVSSLYARESIIPIAVLLLGSLSRRLQNMVCLLSV